MRTSALSSRIEAEAVAARHPDIGHDEVGHEVAGEAERFLAIGGLDNRHGPAEGAAEVPGDVGAEVGVVFGDEHDERVGVGRERLRGLGRLR